MDDFLHNLRNQSNKRFDRNRNKPYEGQFRSNDRFASRDRKGSPQRKPADTDALPAIKRLIEGVLEQQRRTAEFGERTARAAERQAEALESIARQLKRQLPETEKAVKETAYTEAPAGEPLSSEEGAPRDTAADIIREQRAAGRSFEQIAHALNTRHITTVSGKGQWRAQSVSRLYNTLVPSESAAAPNQAGPEA